VGNRIIKMKNCKLIFFGLLMLLWTSCTNDAVKDKKDIPSVETKNQQVIASFNGDSAYNYVAKQVAFGQEFQVAKLMKIAHYGFKKRWNSLVLKLQFRILKQELIQEKFYLEAIL